MLDIAQILFDSQAVTLNPDNPFHFSSGFRSPIYCDNRVLISFPQYRTSIIDAFVRLLTNHAILPDVIAGTATAGIPWAAWIADRLNKPMVYVRSKAKAHGKCNQIEGRIKPNQRVVVIEDLISTGGSAINCVEALRQANTQVTHCCALFNYQLTKAKQAMQQADIQCDSLCTLDQLLNTALTNQTLTKNQLTLIKKWQTAPEMWLL